MNIDLIKHHLSRRSALKLGAFAVASTGIGTMTPSLVAADVDPDPDPDKPGLNKKCTTPTDGSMYTDEMFNAALVAAGGVWTSPYGADDERGTLNEVGPAKTADALSRLNTKKPIKAYQLGEEMFNGFPAFPSVPPRLHEKFLYVLGYDAGSGFAAAGGIQASTSPIGPNLIVGHEERFSENLTFHIGTQIDGLNHIGIGTNDGKGGRFYNDNFAADFISAFGTSKLGNETMGPIVTRGIILDIVGLKVAETATSDYFVASNGQPVLRDNYRITIADIENALVRQAVCDPIGPGDVPILHTGWTHLVRTDPSRYLAQEPGIYLAESRYFQDRRVALVAADNWGLEVLDPSVTFGNAFPCHQELLGKLGVRIGESFVTDSAIGDGVYDGVIVITPQNVPGATAGSSPPVFLGQPA